LRARYPLRALQTRRQLTKVIGDIVLLATIGLMAAIIAGAL
jgi:hypothetical protein